MQNTQQLLLSLPTRKKLSLLDLPEEILSTLSKCVQELPPAHLNDEDGRMTTREETPFSLKELSCTCKKMRRITTPDLFRLVNIDRLVFTIILKMEKNRVDKVDYRQLDRRCQFVSPHAKQLDMKTPYVYTNVLSNVIARIIGLLPSLEVIYNMPRDYLHNRAIPACISVHPKLHYIEVAPTRMTRSLVDPRMPRERLPCTSVYRYHLNLPRPPYFIDMETCLPEILNPEMRVLTLLLSPAVKEIEVLIHSHPVFPDLSALSLFDIRDDSSDRIVSLTDSFLQLNPTIKTLEFDSFDLFFEFAHRQSPSLARLSRRDYRYLNLNSSTWTVPKTLHMAAECQKVAVYTTYESQMKENRIFFDDIRRFIPTLKELAIDLGYYSGRQSAERVEDVRDTITRLAKPLPNLRRLDIHCQCLLTNEQLKPIALSVASENENLELICFGRGLVRPYERSSSLIKAHIKRGKEGNVTEIQIEHGYYVEGFHLTFKRTEDQEES